MNNILSLNCSRTKVLNLSSLLSRLSISSDSICLSTDKIEIPQKPRKPPNCYTIYVKSEFDNVKSLNQNFTQQDVIVNLAKNWNVLDMQEKQKYIDEADKHSKKYQEALEDYKNKLTPEVKQEIQKQQIQQMKKEKLKEKNKEARQLGRPKRPLSVFIQYAFSLDKGTVHRSKFFKIASEKWKLVPQYEKDRLEHKYREDLKAYQKELHKWEEEMKKASRIDLIRVTKQPTKKKSSSA